MTTPRVHLRLPSCLLLLLAAVVGAPSSLQSQEADREAVPFTPGMVVTESVRIEPGSYEVAAHPSLDSALIVVRGDGVELDLTGVRLVGTPVGDDPDRARGVAVRVDGGRDVTIRGARIRGYRFGILARGTRNLRLLDNDLSHSWKPRLYSLVSHESLLDWLSFHDNEDREWMRFGAAAYLEDVTGGEIRGNRAVQGMNGLLMVRTDSVMVRDNELAFNSGLGIGMYRSSHNTVVRNLLDFNVRGYSHGFYERGQDSAGILLYEQSSHNVVAYNSATHSGDGLFLWAGRHTMDTGQGGANDNLIWGNDFSYAPTNAVEVTFSRNTIVANRLEGSRYGVWGGYSWETLIAGNCIADNEFGVAIEHGQDNRIVGNDFRGDSLAVSLWARESQPEDWGYPRNRDVRSRDTEISGNDFAGHAEMWRLENTTGLDIRDNGYAPERPTRGTCDPAELLTDELLEMAPELPADVPREVPPSPLAGMNRAAMVVDEWGPYDWRYPKLWPVDTLNAPVALRVLGPAGRWWVLARDGIRRLSADSGRVGDTVVVTPRADRVGDWSLLLAYQGGPVVHPWGVEREAGDAVPFSFRRFRPATEWRVAFYTWTDPELDPESDSDPADSADSLESLFAGDAELVRREPRLDYQWYWPAIEGLPRERWALEATTTVALPPGPHTLRTISDDGIRVWVDGDLVIDNWRPHGSELDRALLSGGEHEIRVRHYQIGGWTELRVEVLRGAPDDEP